MDYLKKVTDFLQKDSDLSTDVFSATAISDLQESRKALQKDELILDIEPVTIQKTQEETDTHTIYHYKGSFIYGFLKNGIFHILPGDLSTETTRQQNESGEVIFYINKHTNKVETIRETFAENHWGNKQVIKNTPNKGGSFWLKVIMILFVIYFAFKIYYFFIFN